MITWASVGYEFIYFEARVRYCYYKNVFDEYCCTVTINGDDNCHYFEVFKSVEEIENAILDKSLATKAFDKMEKSLMNQLKSIGHKSRHVNKLLEEMNKTKKYLMG